MWNSVLRHMEVETFHWNQGVITELVYIPRSNFDEEMLTFQFELILQHPRNQI